MSKGVKIFGEMPVEMHVLTMHLKNHDLDAMARGISSSIEGQFCGSIG